MAAIGGAVPHPGTTGPERGDAARAAPSAMVLWRITRLSFRYRGRLALAGGLILASSFLSLIVPRLLGRAVDEAHSLLSSGTAARDALFQTSLLLLGVSLLRGLATMMQNYQAEWVSQRVAYDLRLAFFDKLQRLSFGYHDRIHSGDLITRGMIDLEGTRGFIGMGSLRLAMLVMLVVVSVYQMLGTDPVIGALALSFVPVAAWLATRSGLALRRSWRDLQASMSRMTLVMEENLQGIRVVRAFAGREYELGKFDAIAAGALTLSFRRITLRVRASSGMSLAFFSAMGLVIWFGGHKVLAGTMSVGRLTEFLAYMTILQMPVRTIGLVVNSIAQAIICGGRLFEILDLEPEIADAPGATDLVVTQGLLRFEHVDFAYDAAAGARKILSDISFEVGPGKVLALVGPPGSGKSTIAHLIPRFYEATGGRITIDGRDIGAVTLASLRRAVSVIQQDSFLFAISIGENVSYAEPEAEQARIVGAAETAQIHDHVAGMPEGYETIIGERGVSLSGGQRQRLSIARGIVPGPGILVFDDSMSAIDASTEARVRTAIRAAARDKATIIIAHRLSSLMDADEILVIEEGRITERGTHESLLASGGHYRALYELQIRPADEREADAAYADAGPVGAGPVDVREVLS